MLSLVALVLLGAADPPPAARPRIVGPGAAYATLAAAVAAAAPGDTIVVRPGRYPGLLVVDRRVVIVGEPGAVLDGEHRGTVVTLRADSIEIGGLTVRAAGRDMNRDEAAVKLERCHACRVRDLVIEDPLHGIYLLESVGAEISGNRIGGTAGVTESGRGNGIHLFNSTGNRIARNRIRGTRDGIYFSFASGNIVLDNDVAQVRYGLHYMYSDDNRFERNVFAENAAGAAIMFSKRIVLLENVFSRHTGYRAYGILIQTGEQITAERNRIEGNLTGMFLDGATGNTIRDNLIAGNGTGIDVLASAEGNVFTGNVFEHNRVAVRKVLGSSDNAWDEGGRGNWWADSRVFDLDRDGIGDRPFRVGDPFTSLAAERPALELFAGTIAARALSWADEAFPVFDIPRVQDSRPLAVRPGWAAAPSPGASPAAPDLPLQRAALPWLAAALIGLAAVARRVRKAAA